MKHQGAPPRQVLPGYQTQCPARWHMPIISTTQVDLQILCCALGALVRPCVEVQILEKGLGMSLSGRVLA